MKIRFAGLCLVSTLATGVAVAQPLPFNEAGVTMGHWHFVSHDVDTNRKIFVGMGGQALSRPGGAESVRFPGVLINLNFGKAPPGKGGTIGSVVNHVGFIVNNVQEQVAKWKAAGVAVLPPPAFNRNDQAFVETPDGVRIEIGDGLSQRPRERFERIVLNGAAVAIPDAITSLLAPGGRLVGALTIDGIPRLVRIGRLADGSLSQDVGPSLRLSPLTPGVAMSL